MKFFDWIYKEEKTEDDVATKDETVEKFISPEDEDALRRQRAFERLTKGIDETKEEEIPQPTTNESTQGSQEVKVFNIKTNQDLEVVVELIRNGEPCIANLENVPRKEQQHVQDFLSGVSFALNANISLLVQDMYLLTPLGVVIDKKQ